MRKLALLTAAISIISSPAWADCSGPVGIAGEMIYNADHKVMQFCDGTDWISMASTFASGAWANNGGDDLYFSTGNVGIGTTAPSAMLEVRGEDTWSHKVLLSHFGTTTNAELLLRKGEGTAASPSYPSDGTVLGTLGFRPYSTSYGAHIKGIAAEDMSGSAVGTDLAFFTTAKGTAANYERVRVTSEGYVGIGTTSPSHLLHVNGIARSTQSSFATSSDRRVKENIHTMENGLSTLAALRPVTFNYTEEYQNGNAALAGLKRGFIAQEVENVLPEMVSQGVEKVGEREIKDFRILNNSDFVPVLVSAVKELKTIIDRQQQEIDALKAAQK